MFKITGIQISTYFLKGILERLATSHSNNIREKVLLTLFQDIFWHTNILYSHFKLNKNTDDGA